MFGHSNCAHKAQSRAQARDVHAANFKLVASVLHLMRFCLLRSPDCFLRCRAAGVLRVQSEVAGLSVLASTTRFER